MGFDQALKMFRQGHELTRTEWNDPGMVVNLKEQMLWRYEPHHLYTGVHMPWRPSVSDVLAEDWELVR